MQKLDYLGELDCSVAGNVTTINVAKYKSVYVKFIIASHGVWTHIPLELCDTYNSLEIWESSEYEQDSFAKVVIGGIKTGNLKVYSIYSNVDTWPPLAKAAFYGSQYV